jgi:8-oxo-dGTP pyrophosphatase MutT (NUDIX family)
MDENSLSSIIPNSETIVYQGKFIEVIQKNIGGKIFEIARRSPWVRLLILQDDKILLTKERRQEHNAYDYRLPGGKVFDSLAEYNEKLANHENLFTYVQQAAKNECKQETWLIPISLTHFVTNKAWATVERDLYYFIVDQFTPNEQGQELEEDEDITIERKTKEEVKQLCLTGEIKEDRTVGVLFRFLSQHS